METKCINGIALQTLSKSYGNPNEVRARSAHCARYECMLKMTIQTKINKVKTGIKKNQHTMQNMPKQQNRRNYGNWANCLNVVHKYKYKYKVCCTMLLMPNMLLVN